MRAPRSVHSYLAILIAGVLLPLAGFSAFLVIHAALAEQEMLAQSARNRTRMAAAAIENEVASLRGRLFLLAGSLSLQSSDLNDFHARAKQEFGGMTVVLSNAAGQEIVNTDMPYGEALPRNPDPETIPDLARDPLTQRPTITISVPVTRDSRIVYVLSLDISSTLPWILGELDLPDGWVAGIFDRQGVILARARDSDRYVGSLALPDFLERMRSRDEGWVPGTSREGVPVFNAFAHTRSGGWTINVGIPTDILLAPVRQTTRMLLWLGAATLALAIGLAVLIGRRIAGPIVGLVPIAEAVGRGEPAEPHVSGLTEVNIVVRALSDASERLRLTAAGREAATRALTESEQMYRALAEDLARIDDERTALLTGVVVAQEDERKRIARELHDSFAQYLTALRLKLNQLEQSGDQRPGVLGEFRDMIASLGQAVNRMAWELRPVALDELGLRSAIEHYLEEWGEMARLQVDVEIDLGLGVMPPAIEATLFRVLQEATTNVSRHADATRVGVVLEVKDGQARLIVEDNGRGFPAAEWQAPETARRRFGLHGMRERVALVHGRLDVESSPAGTTVFVTIPLGLVVVDLRQRSARIDDAAAETGNRERDVMRGET
jgi:signal transduction histidine kinase